METSAVASYEGQDVWEGELEMRFTELTKRKSSYGYTDFILMQILDGTLSVFQCSKFSSGAVNKEFKFNRDYYLTTLKSDSSPTINLMFNV